MPRPAAFALRRVSAILTAPRHSALRTRLCASSATPPTHPPPPPQSPSQSRQHQQRPPTSVTVTPTSSFSSSSIPSPTSPSEPPPLTPAQPPPATPTFKDGTTEVVTSATNVTAESVNSASSTTTTTPASAASRSLHLSDACVRRLQALITQRETPIVLRVTVDAGGCSGFQYNFDLEDCSEVPPPPSHLKDPTDAIFIRDGATVLVDTISLEYLNGSTIDYKTELISSSFRVADNPNSEASCGCGVSFSPKMDD